MNKRKFFFYDSETDGEHEFRDTAIEVASAPTEAAKEASGAVAQSVDTIDNAVEDVTQETHNLSETITSTPPASATKDELEAWKNEVGGKLDAVLAKLNQAKETVADTTVKATRKVEKKVDDEVPGNEQRKPSRKRGFRRY